ncbi:MAG TPA: phosphoribosylamine--glycine ligase [Candidatus Dormibacteraeota bacterium]|jgi:phosphoribosylamine--glycine ligase|nr:phosphoribosylamine--glycine ligase [Candidatus Dormibacteraeota bacterium]
MKILVVGSGGREHALAWALSKDPDATKIFAAPGNPGIAQVATYVPIQATNVDELARFASKEQIDLTVVGPEASLGAGIVDVFRKNRLRIFGPDKGAAQIETSKSFALDLCSNYNIPIPHWMTFSHPAPAIEALDLLGPPWVVKADGLAAGKGTTVTSDRQEAEAAIRREMKREARRVVIEEFIDGWEASFTATVSGGRAQWLAPVFQDYKPIYDEDIGPNTGGMGVYSPLPEVTPSLVDKVRSRILDPSVKAMTTEGFPFQGVLYLNIIVRHGTSEPRLLEFNARFGDPEAQGIAPLVGKGLLAHMSAVADDSKDPPLPEISSSASVVVVLASKGYPDNPSTGDRITIKELSRSNVVVFHAGTGTDTNRGLVTAGGRVLNIAATGPDVRTARIDAYSTIDESIHFAGMQYRHDIGSGETRRRRLEQVQS